MTVIRGGRSATQPLRATAVAIGNFDGVHIGHQALLSQLVAEAKARQLTPTVLTFDPAPQAFFAADYQSTVRCLTPLCHKIALLAQCGIETLYIQRFDRAFSQLDKQAFVSQELLAQLDAKLVMVGEDFRFGHQRHGSFADLVNMGRHYQFEVLPAQPITLAAQRVSSTWVRQLLYAGEMQKVKKLLGRPYRLTGKVGHGRKLGRQFGSPTANLYFYATRLVVSGIYAVRVFGLGPTALTGVSYVSAEPLNGERRSLVEVFILDFDEDIYGKHLTVEFVHKVRDDRHFDDMPTLRATIASDISAVRDFFANSA